MSSEQADDRHQGFRVGDRVEWTDADDGGMREDGRGTVSALGATLGKLGVQWDENPGFQDWVWPEDLRKLDAVSRLGEVSDG